MGIEHQNTDYNREPVPLQECIAEVLQSHGTDFTLLRVQDALEGAKRHASSKLLEQQAAFLANRSMSSAHSEHSLDIANANLDAAQRGIRVLTHAYLCMQQSRP